MRFSMILREGMERKLRVENFKAMRDLARALQVIGRTDTEFPNSREARRDFIEKNYREAYIYSGLTAGSLFLSFGLWICNYNLEGLMSSVGGMFSFYQLCKKGSNMGRTIELAKVIRENINDGHLGVYDSSMKNSGIDYSNVDFT